LRFLVLSPVGYWIIPYLFCPFFPLHNTYGPSEIEVGKAAPKILGYMKKNILVFTQVSFILWESGIDSVQRQEILLFSIVSRTPLGPTHNLIQRVPGALSLDIRLPGREADYSSPSDADVKNQWRYTFSSDGFMSFFFFLSLT
jgi:hypothetical protein